MLFKRFQGHIFKAPPPWHSGIKYAVTDRVKEKTDNCLSRILLKIVCIPIYYQIRFLVFSVNWSFILYKPQSFQGNINSSSTLLFFSAGSLNEDMYPLILKINIVSSRVKWLVLSQNNQNCGAVWCSVVQCGAELVLHIQLITIS